MACGHLRIWGHATCTRSTLAPAVGATKAWQGVFYPEGLPVGQQLSFYADRYPVVEVDSTFYRSPAPKMVEGWRDRSPVTRARAITKW